MGYSKLGSIVLSLLLLGTSAVAERTTEAVAGKAAGDEKYIIGETVLLDEEVVDDVDDKEYECSTVEIECGQGKTAQVERLFYPQENRAEYIVASESLNYTAKLHSRESEESADTLILTMDVEITQDGKSAKSQQIEWKCSSDTADYSIYYGAETVDIICPVFRDANMDGYLDFLVANYYTSRESWHTIFVWDTEAEEYVKVKIDGSDYTERIASDPVFHDGYLEQWSVVGFYEQRFERFRWDGNELILENEIRMREDAEQGTVVYDKEQDEYIPMDKEKLQKLFDDFREDIK